jgi:hypothetical protein
MLKRRSAGGVFKAEGRLARALHFRQPDIGQHDHATSGAVEIEADTYAKSLCILA